MRAERAEHVIGEVRSPCEDFRIIVVRIGGRQLYEAYRIKGAGALYSLITRDASELDAVLREACAGGCGE